MAIQTSMHSFPTGNARIGSNYWVTRHKCESLVTIRGTKMAMKCVDDKAWRSRESRYITEAMHPMAPTDAGQEGKQPQTRRRERGARRRGESKRS